MLRQALHLLLHEPALFASKLRLRIARQLARRREIRQALRELHSEGTVASGEGDLLVALGNRLPVVILERRPNYVSCAISAQDVPRATAVAYRWSANIGLMVDGSAKRLDPAELVRRCGRASAFTLAPLDDADPRHWHFEIFEHTDTGTLSSRVRRNKIAGVLYGDLFEKPGLTDLTIEMPELVRRVNSTPIDIVYTWVNHADPNWRRAFLSASPDAASADASSESRFYSNDELRYSLRSVHVNLPWAGTIHIVSNCEPPHWLDIAHPQLRWVAHDAILPAECLPTFNSHAIEASLHRIPGLAENFLYFNDDFLAFDALEPSTFIQENGTLAANLERQGVVNSPVDPASPDYLNAARNSARLLYERFGYYPTRLHRHTPYSLSRKLLEELESEFSDAFERTRRSRFRSTSDINVASFLAHHYGFVKRAVVYSGYASALIKSNDPFSVPKMRSLGKEGRRPKVVCLNEGGLPPPTPAWRRRAADFMSRHFPSAAPWERS